ncbi:MAG: hypothetical protein HWN67_08090 [Candidatus Helarchaeota archaeon]|nr:hypothetical protein [Candidatus Helarchaeota archaeon]
MKYYSIIELIKDSGSKADLKKEIRKDIEKIKKNHYLIPEAKLGYVLIGDRYWYLYDEIEETDFELINDFEDFPIYSSVIFCCNPIYCHLCSEDCKDEEKEKCGYGKI